MIFVTGATGLIGSHLTYLLVSQGHDVVALKRKESTTKNTVEIFKIYSKHPDDDFNKIRWVEGDVSDIFSLIEAMQGVDEVYHCAGLVSFNTKDAKRLMQINAEGTANVVNAALECKVKKFCHVSSVATIPNLDKKLFIDESIYWKASPQNSYYAISKYGSEREAWRGAEEGLNVVIVNPSVVLGAGCWGQTSGQIISTSYKGNYFYTEGVTGYVDVRDVVKCMVELMKNNCFNNRYVLNSENLSYKKVFDLIHTQFKKPLPKVKVNRFMLHLASLADRFYASITGKPRRITKELIHSALNESRYSNEKIKKQTGFQFISIEDSVKHICQLYPKNNK